MKLLKILTPRRLQLALLAAPLALAALYYGLFSAERYVSESVLTVRQASHAGGGVPGAALMLAGITPPSREDVLYLKHYIHSNELLRRLDERLHLRQHYEQPRLDPIFRLWSGASQEDFGDYYRDRVEVLLDDVSGLLTVRVQGFDSPFAQTLNRAILGESESFVNELSQGMAHEQLQFAEHELARATEKLQAAKGKVLAFQGAHKVLDASAQAQASGALTSELQAQLSKHEAELKNLLTYLNEDAYQVQALRNFVESLRSQLDVERSRATAPQEGRRLNTLAAEFRDLQLQAGFAEDVYKLALGAVESSRIEATRKLKSLAVIEPPTRPETAEYPRRLYNLITLMVLSTLLYGIVRLIVATIAEHQD